MLTVIFSLGAANTGLAIGDLTISARSEADAALSQVGATLTEMTDIPGTYALYLPNASAPAAIRVQKTADAAVWWEGLKDVDHSQIEALATSIATINTYAELQAALEAGLEAYDVSHSSSHTAGTTLSVSGLVGIASSQGPRSPLLVSDLFDEVRDTLLDPNANNYTNSLMTRYYNRALSECWSLLTSLGAEVAFGTGSIVADGVATDYALPMDFRAFVPKRVLPRSPTTGTTAYSWSDPFTQVGLLDKEIGGSQTSLATPTKFAVFFSGNTQYIRFNTIPPAGEIYDFQYYQECQKISAANISSTYTPWLGLLDQLLARILEEFCREGLEFITTKRDMWRAKAEADIVALLGLRHLHEVDPPPSVWKDFPI